MTPDQAHQVLREPFARGLYMLDQLARTVAALPWFARAGRELTPTCHEVVGDFTAALNRPTLPVKRVASWAHLRRYMAERPSLQEGAPSVVRVQDEFSVRGAGEYGGGILEALLADAAQVAADAAQGAAAGAALQSGVWDREAVRLAAEDARIAARLAGLALVAGQPDHCFVRWLRIYAAGRWPLGVIRDEFRVF